MIRVFKSTQLIRTIIFVLISAILFTSTLIAPISVLSSEVVPSPYIVLDGKAISELNIQDDEKVMISAEHGFVGKTSTVWQIMDKDEEGRWLDISEVYSKELPVKLDVESPCIIFLKSLRFLGFLTRTISKSPSFIFTISVSNFTIPPTEVVLVTLPKM